MYHLPVIRTILHVSPNRNVEQRSHTVHCSVIKHLLSEGDTHIELSGYACACPTVNVEAKMLAKSKNRIRPETVFLNKLTPLSKRWIRLAVIKRFVKQDSISVPMRGPNRV